jgi:hypothetical protein
VNSASASDQRTAQRFDVFQPHQVFIKPQVY